jgi:hypothetical protein
MSMNPFEIGTMVRNLLRTWPHAMSPFEIGMMACFGASWPFAVIKTWRTKKAEGKSLVFTWLVLIGYLSGVLHKIVFNYDLVILLYIYNAVLVLTDLILTYRYRAAGIATANGASLPGVPAGK